MMITNTQWHTFQVAAKEKNHRTQRGEERQSRFLEGQQFVVLSDHLSLAFLRKPQEDMKLQRVVNELEHFTFTVVYKRGSEHIDADALSRCYGEPCCAADDSDIVDDTQHLYDHILTVPPDKFDPGENAKFHHDHLTIMMEDSDSDLPDSITTDHRDILTIRRVEPDWSIDTNQLIKAQMEDVSLVQLPMAFKDEQGVFRRLRPSDGKKQCLVPASFREQFLKLAHATRAGSHFGQDRTAQMLSRIAYWPGMRHDVVQYCRGCLVCQQSKIIKPDRAGMMVLQFPQHGLPSMSTTMDL